MHPRAIEIEWEGEKSLFCMGRDVEIQAMEADCGAGIMEILERFETNKWKFSDVKAPIFWGLVGAGAGYGRAMALVKSRITDNPNGIAPAAIVAHAILTATVIGINQQAEAAA